MAARSRKPKGEVAAATKAAKEDSQRSVMDIPSLQQFLELIGSFSPDLIHHRGSVKSIYHYTDFNGLKGIVEKNDLWLTNSRYSNDDEEMIHGLDVVRQPATELSPDAVEPYPVAALLAPDAKVFWPRAVESLPSA